MIIENDYPVFTYFMECYMCDIVNYTEQAKEFPASESKERSGALCRKVIYNHFLFVLSKENIH